MFYWNYSVVWIGFSLFMSGIVDVSCISIIVYYWGENIMFLVIDECVCGFVVYRSD